MATERQEREAAAQKIDKKMMHRVKRSTITKEELQRRLPKGSSHKITDSVMEAIERLEEDSGLDQGMMEEQILQSLHILQGSNTITLAQYVNAVKYVNLKQFMSNKEAWSIVFREKFNQLEADGKNVDNYVSMFNNSYTVVELGKKMIIAPSLQYNHIFHEMVSNLAGLARGNSAGGRPVTPMVQMGAASKLLDVLAPPEAQQVDVVIGVNDEVKSMQDALAEQLKRVNDAQMARLAQGADIVDVQQIGLNSSYSDITDAVLEGDDDA